MPGAVSSSAYMSAIARRVALRAWWLPALALVVICAGLYRDIRVAILGLMLLFIIYPVIMSFTIMRYATLPSLAERTLANRFDLAGCELIISHIETDEKTGQESIQELGAFHVNGMTHSGSRIIFSVGPGLADIVIALADDIDSQVLLEIESRLEDSKFIAHDD